MFTQYQTLQKHAAHSPHDAAALRHFLGETYCSSSSGSTAVQQPSSASVSVADPTHTASCSSTSASTAANAADSPHVASQAAENMNTMHDSASGLNKLGQKGIELSKTRRQMQDLQQEYDSLKFKFDAATAFMQESTAEHRQKEESFLRTDSQLQIITEELKRQTAENEQTKVCLQRYVKGTPQKTFQRQKQTLQAAQQQVKTQNNRIDCLSLQKKRLQQELRSLRCENTNIQKELQVTKDKVKQLQLQVQQHVQEVREPVALEHGDELSVVRLKNENGHFRNEAIVCVMELIGEHEVPTTRCGEVIKTVVKHVCDGIVPDSDLPSTRSAGRFADRGHVLGKTHITETLLNADQWDMHTDGTSKSGSKFVGQQITVQGR